MRTCPRSYWAWVEREERPTRHGEKEQSASGRADGAWRRSPSRSCSRRHWRRRTTARPEVTIISGARSLSDQVVGQLRGSAAAGQDDRRPPAGVQRPARHPRPRRPEHLRPVRRRRGVSSPRPSRTAGAVRQPTRRPSSPATTSAPARSPNGLFFEEPITIATNLMNVDFASVGNHEFDKGSAELLRIQNGGCHPVEGCTAAPYALPDRRHHGRLSRAPTSSTCRPTSSSTPPARRCSRPTGSSSSRATNGAEVQGRLHRRGAQGHADDRHADRCRRADVPGRGRRRQPRRCGARGTGRRRSPILVIHEGGFQTGRGGAERVCRQPRRQPDRRHRRRGSTRRSR